MRTADLNGVWLLKELSTEEADIPDTLEDFNKDTGWAEAHVPGVVHLDLIRSRKISHLYYGLNELDVKQIESKD
jgi:hypothetical protein